MEHFTRAMVNGFAIGMMTYMVYSLETRIIKKLLTGFAVAVLVFFIWGVTA